MLRIMTILAGLLTLAKGAHQQWAKLTITNRATKDEGLSVALIDFHMKWGHFYSCSDDKKKKVATPSYIDIPFGQAAQLCTTGARFATSGTEGNLHLVALDKELGKIVYNATVSWDSPYFK